MAQPIFEFGNYKKYLAHHVTEAGRRGVISAMARAAGCTHSYLSQVLHGKPDLTPDQSIALADFLKLSAEETEFFLTLVFLARAASPRLKEHFRAQLDAVAKERLQLKSAVKKRAGTELSAEDRDAYYGSWAVAAIHVLTACEEYQTAAKIAARIHRPVRDTARILDWLLQRGFVQKDENRYRHSGKNLHLPTESFHNRANHLHWRLHALHSVAHPGGIHYTSVFAVSRKDMDRLRSRLLAFLERQREEIAESGSEDLMAFCCDLFEP